MGSLGADSLLIDIPLDEAVDICVNQLSGNTNTVEGFTESKLRKN